MKYKALILCALVLAVSLSFNKAPVVKAQPITIVFDYSHGQYSEGVEYLDLMLSNNLTDMGYSVIWAKGGINSSLLSEADALIISSVYGTWFSDSEVISITNWFDSGDKFLWIAGDSDYDGNFINNQTNTLLYCVGSHIYVEPCSVYDEVENCGISYRVVANGTTSNPSVADIVSDVNNVLMHAPTCLYGSNATIPHMSGDPLDLENYSITNVVPLLFYSTMAEIVENDLTFLAYAHTAGQKGAFVAAALEFEAGDLNSSLLMVSGASPYGDHYPMYSYEYYSRSLDGWRFVHQAIQFCMNEIGATTSTTSTTPTTTTTPTSTTTTSTTPTTTTTPSTTTTSTTPTTTTTSTTTSSTTPTTTITTTTSTTTTSTTSTTTTTTTTPTTTEPFPIEYVTITLLSAAVIGLVVVIIILVKRR